jgi:hypothetical protein
LIALWGCGSLFGIWIRCDPQGVLDNSKACVGQVLRWQLIGAFNSITELMVFLLSTGLVWRLQMRLELKLRVILAFIFRLPWCSPSVKSPITALIVHRLIPIAIVHFRYIEYMPTDNLTFAIITPLTWETIELGYSLLSVTIPNLKSFIMSFDTAMMMVVSYKLNSYTQSQAIGANPSDHQDFDSSKGSKFPTLFDIDSPNDFIGRLRPEDEDLRYTGEIRHFDDWSPSNDDCPPAGPRRDVPERTIRRDVHWRIEQTDAS